MQLFINASLILEDRIEENGYLVEEQGRILAFGPMSAAQTWAKKAGSTIDCRHQYLSPGFVDIHTHGSGGFDYMDGTVEAFEQAAKAHLRYGATTILPTTLASTDKHLYQTLDVFKQASALTEGMPHLPGLHLEGPYFSPLEKGAMEMKHLRLPDERHYLPVVEYADGLIRRWSLAPELEGALQMADKLVPMGIRLSAAHTAATYEQMSEAFDHGINHLTHFYSAMSTITRRNGFRILGVVESGYLIDGLTLEVIADGMHLPPALLRLVYQAKKSEQICACTDSMRAAGLPEGPSILGPIEGGTAVIVEDGIAKMPDKSCFAGSVATCDRMVRVLMRDAGLSLWEAVRASSLLPASFMGLGDVTGSIVVGKQADLLVFDRDITIERVFVSGKEVQPRG